MFISTPQVLICARIVVVNLPGFETVRNYFHKFGAIIFFKQTLKPLPLIYILTYSSGNNHYVWTNKGNMSHVNFITSNFLFNVFIHLIQNNVFNYYCLITNWITSISEWWPNSSLDLIDSEKGHLTEFFITWPDLIWSWCNMV